MANFVIKNNAGGDVGLELDRSTNTDWRLLASSGNLYIQHKSSNTWSTSLLLNEASQSNGLISTSYKIQAAEFLGNASTATKLTTETAGDSNTPVYFTGGKPVACISLDLNTTGNAATATKATQDGDGAVISSTYLKLAGGTMTGTIVTPGNDSVVIKPAKNNYDQIGASDCKFWKIHASTFIGNLTGTASIASTLAESALETTDAADAFLAENTFKVAKVTAAATAINNDGMILSAGYSGGWGAQIWLDDGSGAASMRIRNRSSATAWNPWRQVLTENNYNSYAPTLTGTGASGTWGINVTGRSRFLETKHQDGSAWYGDNYPLYAQWETSNICKLKCDGYYTKVDYANNTRVATKSYLGGNIKSGGASGYHQIFINSANHWMTAFTIRVYQAYQWTDIVISGYNYGSDHWYSPQAIILGSTPGITSMNVTFGYTSDYNLWVAIPANNYFGIEIIDCVAGYAGFDDWIDLFTVNNVSSLSGTTQTTVTAVRPWYRGESITSAVWNDYAEYRESDCQEFGRVLMEKGDDSLTITNERLSHFAGISSDTWGFSQGETEKAKTPIAVAGRVLAYPYQNRNNYKPGDCVCAAPGGTVDIMAREEIIKYPDRIVGTVSCVPDYEDWGGGDRPPVKVNGRIWIKIK